MTKNFIDAPVLASSGRREKKTRNLAPVGHGVMEMRRTKPARTIDKAIHLPNEADSRDPGRLPTGHIRIERSIINRTVCTLKAFKSESQGASGILAIVGLAPMTLVLVGLLALGAAHFSADRLPLQPFNIKSR